MAYRAEGPPPDPLSPLAGWRDAVVDPMLEPPPVTARSPLLGLVDTQLDPSHPEFQGSRLTMLSAAPVRDSLGTATASVAAAPANGVGILGIWPGMRVVSSPLPAASDVTCAQVTRRLRRAVDAGAAVVSMGYGFRPVSGRSGTACFSQYVAVQQAVRDGVIPVASAGLTLPSGTRLDEPASLPHVITVAAVDATRQPSSFLIASRAIDLAAPGVGIVAAVPLPFDRDGTPDGYRERNGTALSAAMVGAAAAWLLATNSSLTPDQVASVLRTTAQDIAAPGYDALTGSGLLQVGPALALDPPTADAREPNEDIPWVNGRYLKPPQRPYWSGGRARTTMALLDRFEDPHDVYPVEVPARTAIRVRVTPQAGDPSLEAYNTSARTVDSRRRRLGRSRAGGQSNETLELRNPAGRDRILYLHVFLARGADERGASYTLKVSAIR
jgi:hypothetical protein